MRVLQVALALVLAVFGSLTGLQNGSEMNGGTFLGARLTNPRVATVY